MLKYLHFKIPALVVLALPNIAEGGWNPPRGHPAAPAPRPAQMSVPHVPTGWNPPREQPQRSMPVISMPAPVAQPQRYIPPPPPPRPTPVAKPIVEAPQPRRPAPTSLSTIHVPKPSPPTLPHPSTVSTLPIKQSHSPAPVNHPAEPARLDKTANKGLSSSDLTALRRLAQVKESNATAGNSEVHPASATLAPKPATAGGTKKPNLSGSRPVNSRQSLSLFDPISSASNGLAQLDPTNSSGAAGKAVSKTSTVLGNTASKVSSGLATYDPTNPGSRGSNAAVAIDQGRIGVQKNKPLMQTIGTGVGAAVGGPQGAMVGGQMAGVISDTTNGTTSAPGQPSGAAPAYPPGPQYAPNGYPPPGPQYAPTGYPPPYYYPQTQYSYPPYPTYYPQGPTGYYPPYPPAWNPYAQPPAGYQPPNQAQAVNMPANNPPTTTDSGSSGNQPNWAGIVGSAVSALTQAVEDGSVNDAAADAGG